MHRIVVPLVAILTALTVPTAWAQGIASETSNSALVLDASPAMPERGASAPPTLRIPSILSQFQDDQPAHPRAVEHSQGYQTRATIHKYASFATLPLFATELALGQSLYNGSATGSKRAAHGAVGASIGALFAINTVTGAWNMFGEGRKEPQGRTRRLVHGLLMMAADAGFAATGASAPESEGGHNGAAFQTNKSTHRTIALASIGLGTAGYLTMLLGHR